MKYSGATVKLRGYIGAHDPVARAEPGSKGSLLRSLLVFRKRQNALQLETLKSGGASNLVAFHENIGHSTRWKGDVAPPFEIL